MVQERQFIDAAAFDQWVAAQPEEKLFEFINGMVIEKPNVTSAIHSSTVCNLISYLVQHLRNNDIDGYVTGETSGYLINDKRCIPDAALVLGQTPTGEAYSTNQPILVIEVISDDENSTELRGLALKREVYLEAGIIVWEGSITRRYVDVYTPDGRYRRVRDTLTLDALPDLSIPLDNVFRR